MCDCVPGVPVIVAKQAFTGQTASIAATTIYTPDVDGDFELSVYAVVDPSLSGVASISALWTDEYGSYDVSWCDANPTIPGKNTQTLHVTSGNPIQIASLYSKSGPALPYDVFVTVTRK